MSFQVIFRWLEYKSSVVAMLQLKQLHLISDASTQLLIYVELTEQEVFRYDIFNWYGKKWGMTIVRSRKRTHYLVIYLRKSLITDGNFKDHKNKK